MVIHDLDDFRGTHLGNLQTIFCYLVLNNQMV